MYCDRINLKTVHFKYAQHLESLGKLADAARHYVESGTASTEVTDVCQACLNDDLM
jgi:hypothetical protein